MEWQTHRRTKLTYDLNPVGIDSFPLEPGWYDIYPLLDRVDVRRSYSNPASDHPHKAISLDFAMGTRARLESRSLEESSAGNGLGGPTAPHLASASGLVAETAGSMGAREDTEIDVGRNRSRFRAASAAFVVCMAFASPTVAVALDWAWLTRTVAVAIECQLRGTEPLPWYGSVSVLDPVGSGGEVSRTLIIYGCCCCCGFRCQEGGTMRCSALMVRSSRFADVVEIAVAIGVVLCHVCYGGIVTVGDGRTTSPNGEHMESSGVRAQI